MRSYLSGPTLRDKRSTIGGGGQETSEKWYNLVKQQRSSNVSGHYTAGNAESKAARDSRHISSILNSDRKTKITFLSTFDTFRRRSSLIEETGPRQLSVQVFDKIFARCWRKILKFAPFKVAKVLLNCSASLEIDLCAARWKLWAKYESLKTVTEIRDFSKFRIGTNQITLKSSSRTYPSVGSWRLDSSMERSIEIVPVTNVCRSAWLRGLSFFVPGSARLIFPGIQTTLSVWYISYSCLMQSTSTRIDLSIKLQRVESELNVSL